MTYKQLLDHFGGQQKVADALNCKQNTVSDWRDGIPRGRQFEIKDLTDGALQVDTKFKKGR